MNDVGTNTKPLSQQGQDVANKAADKVQSGIQSTQDAANKAMNKASDKVDQLKSDASPMLDKVTDQAQKLMQQGREVFNDTSKIVRDRATQASDLAVDYTKDEPVKAMLIAAAAGALLMGLVSMMARSRD